ncbi:hypothetical protein C8035_v003382 [Colletotrichum spinosum]|uniref:Aminoglycoside phosphotransferase domain-containing protein n=1 Tax=Colletotrichum spinosum TaxID=1347390 RepID=A0A4R8QPY0_9PEZI|nr:hypothetical protein C8035_v003382 [Colletotrichum spinosum]
MRFIQENSSLRVPHVFAYDTDVNNAATLPSCSSKYSLVLSLWMLSVAIKYTAVQMTSLRLPKIGTIFQREDGGYDSGPIPGIGGPFDTAAAFFEAWADKATFQLDRDTITQMMQRGPLSAEDMVKIIDVFPSQIKSVARRLPLRNEGPFPLCHDDFLHSNIMVDEGSFKVTGVIDWEGACTVPWGLVAYPEFIQVMPRSFDLPEHYDQDGQPLKESVKEKWRERRDYVEMVKTAEGEDSLLSTALGSNLNQALAYSYGAFTTGKLGSFDRVAAELEKGTSAQ